MNTTERIGLSGLVFIILSIMFLNLLFMFNMPTYSQLVDEDALIENMGCLFLLLSALALLATSLVFYVKRPACYGFYGALFLLAAFAFFWGAGEEISWGQRIVGFSSPEYFADHNTQQEFNLHNFDTKFFNKSLENIHLLMILVPTILLGRKRSTIIGIPVPGVWLIFGLQIAMSFSTHVYIEHYKPISLLCLLFWLYHGVKTQDRRLLNIGLVTLVVITFTGIVNYLFRDDFSPNDHREVREFLFSAVCFFYALSLYWYFRLKHRFR